MRTCTVPQCGRTPNGWSQHCNRHRINTARHGGPLQRNIKASEVGKIAKHLDRWIKGRENQNVILEGMHRAWLGVITNAKAELTRLERGGVIHRDHIKAFGDIAKVGRDVPWVKIALTAMAVSYMAGADRRLFDSDRCYYHCLARRFRTLTDSSVARRWDHVTQTNRRIYSCASPERMRFLGEVLANAFGPLGMSIQAKEAQAVAEASRSRREVLLAISESCATTT